MIGKIMPVALMKTPSTLHLAVVKSQNIFLFVGLMVMLPYQQGNAQTKRPDGKASAQKLVYQTYGLPELYRDKAMHEVLARYGVEMRAVAGCIVTDSLLKGVARNNRAVFAALDKRLGTDAKARIMAEVEGVAMTQQKVEEVLRKAAVRQKEAALAKAGNGSLTFSVKPAKAANSFDVAADVLQYGAGTWQRSHWKNFVVDTLRGTVH